jgi:hypothetical protein
MKRLQGSGKGSQALLLALSLLGVGIAIYFRVIYQVLSIFLPDVASIHVALWHNRFAGKWNLLLKQKRAENITPPATSLKA